MAFFHFRRSLQAAIRSALLSTAGVIGCLYGHPSSAHPHAWIEVKTTFVLNDRYQVGSVKQEWRFDEMYTSFLMQNTTGEWKSPSEFTSTALRNLAEFGYFTEVYIGGHKAKLAGATAGTSEVKEGRLVMRFEVMMENPRAIDGQGLSFSVYDPTFYIEVTHAKEYPIAFEGPGSGGCYGKISLPKPSVQMLSLARSMDRNAAPNTSLGKAFAEIVNIRC